MRRKLRAIRIAKAQLSRQRKLSFETLEGRELLAGVAELVQGFGSSVDPAPTAQSSAISTYVPPPITVTPTNPVQTVRVIVLNYEPTVPSMDNRTLWDIFNWNDPRDLAAGFVSDVETASGGAIDYQIVEWRDRNEFPIFTDGFRYKADNYVHLRQTNPLNWWNNNPADFYTIAEQQGLADLVNNNVIDEIWMFGDHFFNLLGEAWMAGPRSFFINGPSFPDFPVDRAVAGFGFNYERGVAEMLHNFGHRTENHMSRAYDGWNIANPVTPWDHFTANVDQTNRTTFGVGSVHFPSNGTEDYDYDNPQTVSSYADEFIMNFPNQNYNNAVPMHARRVGRSGDRRLAAGILAVVFRASAARLGHRAGWQAEQLVQVHQRLQLVSARRSTSGQRSDSRRGAAQRAGRHPPRVHHPVLRRAGHRHIDARRHRRAGHQPWRIQPTGDARGS